MPCEKTRIHFKYYFKPHVQFVFTAPPRLADSRHTGRVGLQFYKPLIARTREIYLVLSCGTTLDTRGKIQGAYKSSVGHGTVIWLVRGMKSTKRPFACAGHMQRCLIACDVGWKPAQSGDLELKSRLGRDTNELLVLHVSLSYMSVQVFWLGLWWNNLDRLR